MTDPVTRLATVVSIAARIEPELLRAARLQLLPDVDASAEADLWFSGTLVASRSTRRVVLDAEIAASLRESLANDPALLNAARAVVLETHANAPPAIQLEEEILYLALTGADVAEAINTKLTSVLNAIANEGRSGLVDWAARALPSMPDVVQNTTAAAALRLVSGGQRAEAMHVRRAVLDDPAIAALVERALPKTKVYARLVPGLAVEISRVPLPSSHEIELPKTEPLVLELTTANQSEVVEVPREGTLTRTIVDSVSIRTIARDVFRLEEAREGERGTVRLLVTSGLTLPDEPNIDAVLVAGTLSAASSIYTTVPIFAVPGPRDVNDREFIDFRARTGFTSDQIDFAKSVQLGRYQFGIVGIDTRKGIDAARIQRLCNGDPLAWARSHDYAILLVGEGAENLDRERADRWRAFGAEDVFDFVVSRDIPEDGYVVVEVPDPDGQALVSIHRGGNVEVRRQKTHAHAVTPLPGTRTRSVLVAGIAEQLSIPLQELCRAIGTLLALQKCVLITGGWPGVDYLVAEGYEEAEPGFVEFGLVHHMGGLRKAPDYPRGRQVVFETDEEAISAAVHGANFVILIEGVGGTLAVGREALRQGKPVIPIGSGAAADLRPEVLSQWPADRHATLARLGNRSRIALTVGAVHELLRKGTKIEPAPGSKSAVFLHSSAAQSLVDELKTMTAPVLRETPKLFPLETLVPADIAIVLLDRAYLAESHEELRALIERARRGDIRLHWFLASRCDYESTGIADFQAANDIALPLDELPEALRRAAFRYYVTRNHAPMEIPEGIGEDAYRTVKAIEAALEELRLDEVPFEEAGAYRAFLRGYDESLSHRKEQGLETEAARLMTKIYGLRTVRDRVKVAVGSAASELAEYRAAVHEVIAQFPAVVPRDAVSRADLYVGILGFRYGVEVSAVELEYREAMERRIPTLMFFMSEGLQEEIAEEELRKLAALKGEIRAHSTVIEFASVEELRHKVAEALTRQLIDIKNAKLER